MLTNFISWAKSRVLANTATLLSATIITQVVSFIAVPLLARFYGPSEYGLSTPVLSVALVIGAIACGRYELAILLPDTDNEAKGVVLLSFIISIIVSALLLLVIGALQFFGRLVNPLYWFMVVLVPLIALGMVLNNWLNREKDYKTIALARVIESVAIIGFQIIFAIFFTPSSFYLLLGNLIGTGLAVLLRLVRFFQSGNKISMDTFQLAWQMAIRYQRFPRVEAWGAFANKFGSQLPVFLLQIFTSTEIVGIYSMAVRLLGIPINLLGASFNSVFYEKIASINRLGRSSWLTVKRMMMILAGTSLIPYVILLVGANTLIPMFLGAEWFGATGMIQNLSLAYWMNGVYSPLSLIFVVQEKQHKALLSHMLIFVIPNITLTLLLIALSWKPLDVFIGFGIVKFLLYLLLSLWVLIEARNASTMISGNQVYDEYTPVR